MGELWHESASVQGVGFGGQNAYVGKYRVSRRMHTQAYTDLGLSHMLLLKLMFSDHCTRRSDIRQKMHARVTFHL